MRRVSWMQPSWTTLVIIVPFIVTVLGNGIMGQEQTLVAVKPQNMTSATNKVPAIDCQNLIPPKGECSFHGNVNITINATFPCVYSCTYNPKNGLLRMEVHLTYKYPSSNPTFVSVEQTSFLNSWSLPIIFPVHGENQKFTSLEELLCPPVEKETLKVRITTRSDHNISMLFSVRNETYTLNKGANVSVTSTPVSPWYKLYQWTRKEDSVLITADSQDNSNTVCAILALQNAECPVDTDETGLRGGRGRFQTFNARAGMVAWRNDFPDGIHIIVLALPDDEPCSLSSAQTTNHTKRHKTVVLAVYDHATMWSSWYIYLITALVLVVVTGVITKLALASIIRTIGASVSDDQRQLLEESMESFGRGCQVVESGGAIITGANNLNAFDSRSMNTRGMNFSSGVGSSGRNESEEGRGETEGMEGEALPAAFSLGFNEDDPNMQDNAIVLPTSRHLAVALPASCAPDSSLMNFTATFNPQFVWWWKRMAVLKSQNADAQVAEVGFKHGVVIMAVFTALPITELIRSYLRMLMHHGQEDQCFFNSRCLTAFGTLPDFTRVFTNIGYIFTGIALYIIVKKHQKLTDAICNFSAYNNVGVSRHYGLFITLGYSLIIQGIMSSLYHTCPNIVTLRLDVLFMYVVLVITVIITWGLRHGDVTHHIYPTLGFMSVVLIMAEVHEWIDKMVFWAVFSTIYSLIILTNTVLLTYYGQWSFSPYKMWCVRKIWKPLITKLDEVVRQEDQSSQPIKVLRIMCGLALNAVLIVYGFVVDPNIYRYILIIFLSNIGLYFGNYIMTKRLCYREKGTVLAWVSLMISLLLWILALVAFYFHTTDSEASPSASRALNSPCDFWVIYDTHDLWHVLSAFALFTFFLGVLTLDDDLCHTPSEYIHVF